jgi:hypothetical protein
MGFNFLTATDGMAMLAGNWYGSSYGGRGGDIVSGESIRPNGAQEACAARLGVTWRGRW